MNLYVVLEGKFKFIIIGIFPYTSFSSKISITIHYHFQGGTEMEIYEEEKTCLEIKFHPHRNEKGFSFKNYTQIYYLSHNL